jgi:hypothetical protein
MYRQFYLLYLPQLREHELKCEPHGNETRVTWQDLPHKLIVRF